MDKNKSLIIYQGRNCITDYMLWKIKYNEKLKVIDDLNKIINELWIMKYDSEEKIKVLNGLISHLEIKMSFYANERDKLIEQTYS